MNKEKKFLDQEGVKHLWSKISVEDYPNNETLMAVINAIDDTKADRTEISENIKKYFLVVETTKDGTNYLLDGITFSELYDKFQLGNVNMVCHVDDTDYIPLLSVTPSKIIFSGIYNTTSVSLDFNSEGVGTLSSTYLCDRSSLTTHTSNNDIHVTATEKEKWNNIEPSITTAIDDDMGNVILESNSGIAYIEDALKQEIIDAVLASLNTETLTFTLDDGTIVTKKVVVML